MAPDEHSMLSVIVADRNLVGSARDVPPAVPGQDGETVAQVVVGRDAGDARQAAPLTMRPLDEGSLRACSWRDVIGR
jgi:hypothetical protein